jgi:molecular chaperone DnaJ
MCSAAVEPDASRSRVQRGADLREDLTLEFEEAFFGTESRVTVRRHEACENATAQAQRPGKARSVAAPAAAADKFAISKDSFSIARTCPTCQGTGSVITDPCPKCKGEGRLLRQRTVDAKVPAGVEDGTRIRFTRGGEVGQFGGPAGDLVRRAACEGASLLRARGQRSALRSPDLRRAGSDGRRDSGAHHGWRARAEDSRRHSAGATFRIRNKGVPVLNGHGKGDLYVEVLVQIPTKLNKRQKELLQELDALTQVDNQPLLRSILGKMKDMFG